MINEQSVSTADLVSAPRELREIAKRYQQPSVPRAVWQMVNTFGPYGLLWWAMYYTKDVSWWLTIPLAVLAGAFLIRVFIIFHDCGHGSFFASRTANTVVGFFAGLLTLTPYHHWRWEHSVHHATSGNLDERGMGDIWTLTVREYLAASRWKKLAYRLARNPVLLFGVAPLFIFVIWQRIPTKSARPREKWSVHLMNLALVVKAVALSRVFGWQAYLAIQLVAMMVAGGAGLWMFYVQHQFEDVYWEHDAKWDHTAAALEGSSFYKLPRLLQWFSGNIGFHHIHHLNANIPNYNLERCHRACPQFQAVQPLTLRTSLKSLRLRLWDEQERRMVGYDHLRRCRNARS